MTKNTHIPKILVLDKVKNKLHIMVSNTTLSNRDFVIVNRKVVNITPTNKNSAKVFLLVKKDLKLN